jgi:hypothetical protein
MPVLVEVNSGVRKQKTGILLKTPGIHKRNAG